MLYSVRFPRHGGRWHDSVSQEKLKNLETKIRQDFEACKAELQEERQSADAQQELIRDVAKPHFSLRPQNSRKRPRRHLLDVDDGESDGFTSTKPGSSTSKAKRCVWSRFSALHVARQRAACQYPGVGY